MKKSQPQYPGENGVYVNANPLHDIKGSIPQADFFNIIEQELLNVLSAAGLEQSEENTQIEQAIKKLSGTVVHYQSLYQRLKTVENGVVQVEDEKIVGWAEVIADTTFNFDLAKVTKTGEDDIITFELYVNMPTPVGIVWPENIDWGKDEEAPDMSEAGLYLLTFRYIRKIDRWQASPQITSQPYLPPEPETPAEPQTTEQE